MDFWDRLDWLLKERSVTRKQVCETVGISPSSISVWKTRHSLPDADVALALARALNVTVEYLLEGPQGENQNPVTVSSKELVRVYTIANENFELQGIIDRLIDCDRDKIRKITDVIDVLLR